MRTLRSLGAVIFLTLLVSGLPAGAHASCQGQPVVPAAGAQAPTLTGRVIDAESMRPIAGAIVQVGETRAVTTRAGRFALHVPSGEVRATVSAEGYLSDEVRVTVGSAPVVIEIVLLTRNRFKDAVTVTGTGIPASASPATIEVPPLAVRTVAGAAENIFRTLQTLPGVNAAADFDSRISVRGGGPDQNLTIMDGIEIHAPFRLYSLTSAFNPETVQSFELTAGGFGAKYGDRLSSILEVENRPGARGARLRATAGLSVTDTNIVVEGRLPGGRNGSWIATGRRTYYDFVANHISDTKMPAFADLQAKTEWEVARGGRLTLLGLRSRERSKVEDIVGSTRNDLLAASLALPLGRGATSRTVVAWSQYADGLRWNEEGPFYAVPTQPGEMIGPADLPAVSREVGLRDVSVREEAGLDLGHGHLVGAGFDAHALRARWSWKVADLKDLKKDDMTEASVFGFRGDFVMPTEPNSREDSARAGAWLQDTYRVASFATLQAGVRADWSRLAHETTISPRLSATVSLPGKLRLRGATGLYTQSPGYEKLLQSDYFVNLTGSERLSIKSQRSVHLLAALERDFRGGFLVRIEGYHKSFDRLIVGQLEAPAAVAARVALYRYPQSLAFSVPSEPRLTSIPANDATGRAYGIDLYVSRRATSASDRFNGWASYTFGHAEMEAYGRRFPFDYDRRHAFSLVGVARLSARFDLASTVRIASGFPYTPDELRVFPRTVSDPATGRVIGYVPLYDSRAGYRWTLYPGGLSATNSQRLPVFARVDMRLSFRPASHPRWQLYVDIINVLNRKNASWYDSRLEHEPGASVPRVVRKPTAGVPFLPSLGCRVYF